MDRNNCEISLNVKSCIIKYIVVYISYLLSDQNWALSLVFVYKLWSQQRVCLCISFEFSRNQMNMCLNFLFYSK